MIMHEDVEQAGFRPHEQRRPDEGGGRRRRAAGVIHFSIGDSSLGLVLAARSDKGLSAVLFGADRDALRRDLHDRFPGATLTEDDAGLETLVAQVLGVVEAPARGLAVPLDVRGTVFQRTVWQALREIPAGSTVSYSDIANRIGLPTAVRAVAQACAANALAVVVPCHRVVTRDGKLSGYRWGIERKRALLDREATACAPPGTHRSPPPASDYTVRPASASATRERRPASRGRPAPPSSSAGRPA